MEYELKNCPSSKLIFKNVYIRNTDGITYEGEGIYYSKDQAIKAIKEDAITSFLYVISIPVTIYT